MTHRGTAYAIPSIRRRLRLILSAQLLVAFCRDRFCRWMFNHARLDQVATN